MKKSVINILLLFVFGLYGCGDFLEESSQDEVRPSTVSELEQLLLGEGYPRQQTVLSAIELMTDNVESSFSADPVCADVLQKGVATFTWQKDMYERAKEKNAPGMDSWQYFYQKIKGCNVVLDMLGKVDGSEEEKLNQKGQALGLRAFYYFILVNLYGQPYNAEGIDLETSPGVPLVLTSQVKDEFPPRASVGAVYERVEKDLLEALPLLEKHGQNNLSFKVTPLFVHLLLSRVYLYMENWEKAAEYASNVIEQKPALLRMADCLEEYEDMFGRPQAGYNRDKGSVLSSTSLEFIWGYSANNSWGNYYQSANIYSYPGALPAFSVSASLLDLYRKTEGDLRLEFYFDKYIVTIFPPVTGFLVGYKGNPSAPNVAVAAKGMRVAEAYLNRAEANIRLFLEKGSEALRIAALADLNELRSKRIDPYVDVDIEDGNDLLEFCFEERRMEFAFEDHRWFDLRRWGMPELKHDVTIVQGQTQTFTLEEGSARYVLPIAQEVLDKNPALRQNP